MIYVVLLLLLSIIAGLWRTWRGPFMADRLLGLQMTGTTSVALLLVMAEWLQQPAMRDVAVILAILAAGLTLALVQTARRSAFREHETSS